VVEVSDVKPREDRQKVMIKARMRSGASWQDVCILNVSLHGLGLQMAKPPERGSYVEICRGNQTIIARVAWSKGHRVGLRSQDTIFIRALINDNTTAPQPQIAYGHEIERRRAPRRALPAHDRSRLVSRSIQFALAAVAAAALAITASATLTQALAAPLSQISVALT